MSRRSIPASFIPLIKPPALSAGERCALRALAGTMIPASARYGVPSADDEAIFADIEASLGRDGDAVRQALAQLEAPAGRPFDALAPDERLPATLRLRDSEPALADALVAAVVRCYYRDDRVMRSIGMEPRPPYPQGHEVEQGDWSLLEPVRARGPIWRVPGGDEDARKWRST
ncbi:MAG TPA: hypothetical protein PKA20_04450 [Burkholderiaceae bacterium]|nr:hypothetical protein [Burkholderiaceae bacterium]